MKHSQDDTIAAIATPLGIGGVGIVRVSGQKAKKLLSGLFKSTNGQKPGSHRMLSGWISDPKTKGKIDRAMACLMRSPKSYTGEDVLEFYCHGGIAVLQKVLGLCLASGARLAEKGEFTKRAFLHGKMDLTQAEAVLDLVKARTEAGVGFSIKQLEGRLSGAVAGIRKNLIALLAELEARIDFSDDLPELNDKAFLKQARGAEKEIAGLLASAEEGRVYREGLASVIVGKPNVGKSSLLNALLGEDRVIVTNIPGTTRDAIEETVNIKGLPLRIIDTAGIRHPRDRAEEYSVRRAEQEFEAADLALFVVNASAPLSRLDKRVLKKLKGRKGLVILNKIDLGLGISKKDLGFLSREIPVCQVSALYGTGIFRLKERIFKYAARAFCLPREGAFIINARHKQCLLKAKEALEKALESGKNKAPIDFITIDLKTAVIALGEVTGELVSEEVINAVFEQFCVGK